MGGEGCNRPVINLKILMVFIPCPLALIQEHAERERLDLKKDLKVDLKDAYFGVPLHRKHQKCISFW